MDEQMTRHYGEGAVFGSMAYDFNNPELYPEAVPGEYGRTAAPETRTETRTRTKAAPRTRQSISPFSILGIAAAAFLLIVAINSQASLFAVSGESAELEATLSALESEQTKLRIAYESAFNLAEVEDYAIHTLGMQKPAADQITYIDTAASDRAVVIERGSGEGFIDRASDFFSGIGSYLGGN